MEWLQQHPVVMAVGYSVLGAVLVDLHAWSQTDDPFNWRKASKRWVGTAVTALGVALGIEGLS